MKTINVQSFIDERPLKPFHAILFALMFLTILLDGLDASAMGLIAPALLKQMQATRADLAPVLSASLIGIGVGAALGAPFADRIGRRLVLILSVALFGGTTIWSAQSSTLHELMWSRFFTGIGLGAAIPLCATMMNEFLPSRMRSRAVNGMLFGYAVGGGICGPLARSVIPQHGWQGYLMVCGVAPLIVAVLLLFFLPESVRYLATAQKDSARIAGVLSRIDPTVDFSDAQFIADANGTAKKHRFSFVELFSKELAVPTLLLWVAYICSTVVLYVLLMWTPTIMSAEGRSLAETSNVMMAFNWFSGIAILLGGILMDKFGSLRVISIYFAISAILAVVVGITGVHGDALLWMLVLTAMGNNGACSSMSTLATQMYPTSSRATGAAWVLAVGRFGGVAGTFLGATLIGLGWPLTTIVAAVALPTVIASIAIICIGFGIPSLRHRNDAVEAKAAFHG